MFEKTDALLALDKNAVSAKAAVGAVETNKVDIALVTEHEAIAKLERSQVLQSKGIVSELVLGEQSKTPMTVPSRKQHLRDNH